MPVFYLSRLTGRERTQGANQQLARYLAFTAGAVNAGGYLAVRQYTSHLTGIVSGIADDLAVGKLPLIVSGIVALATFVLGAMSTTLMILWARRHRLESEYALPLVAEALVLIAFGLDGHSYGEQSTLRTVALLSFTMGLQNAIMTKISGTIIRTTHITGIVTDVGIKLGRMIFSVLIGEPFEQRVELQKLRLLTSIICLFLVGGLTGAIGFKHIGFLFTLPFAATLLVLAVVPIVDDLRQPRQPRD